MSSIGLSTLSTVLAPLEQWAKDEWAKIEAEGIKIEQEVEPVLESGLALAVKDFGQIAVQTVVNLMGAAGTALSGGEKLNLTATTIVQAAESAGKTIASQDVTALAQNAYTAVVGQAPAQGESVGQEVEDVANKVVDDVKG